MIEINNLFKGEEKIDKAFIKKTAENVLKEEGVFNKNMEISIAIVDSLEIKKINNHYRKKNKPTDVLSFGKIGEDLLEIVICPKEVKKNGEVFKEELKRVVIHGILHLIGYDHEKSKKEALEMFAKQDKYFQN